MPTASRPHHNEPPEPKEVTCCASYLDNFQRLALDDSRRAQHDRAGKMTAKTVGEHEQAPAEHAVSRGRLSYYIASTFKCHGGRVM